MERRYNILLLGAITILTFFFTSGLLNEGYPSGGDTVSHYDLLLNTKDALRTFFHTGELRLWNPDYYMGFPMFFFYTPVPYVTLALLLFLPGINALFLLKLTIVIFFSLLPFLFYFTAKIMDLEEPFALGIALFSTALSSITVFGLEYYSFFATGLYAQLWGIVFLPVSFAFCYRYLVLKKGRIFFPIIFLYLTFLSHIFTGIIAICLFLFLLFSALFFEKQPQSRMFLLKNGFFTFLLFFISISFFVIPYLLNQDYFGNITFDIDYKEHGYGITETLHLLLTGDLLDYSFSFSRFPVLTLLFFVGLASSFLWKTIRQKYAVLSLTLFSSLIFSIVCIAGETSFGFLQWIPFLSSLQTFRFITLFHFVALFYIGISIFWMQSKKQHFFFIALLIFLILVFSERIQTFQEYADTYILEQDADYSTLTSALEKNSFLGRVYVTSASGLYDMPQHLQALPLLTGKPIFASAGIGGHDSLSAYYSSLPILSDAPYLVGVLGIDAIVDKKADKPGLTLYLANNKSSLFDLVHAPLVVAATPVASRDVVVEWLFSPLPSSKIYLQIDETKIIPKLSSDTSYHTYSYTSYHTYSNISYRAILQNIEDTGDVFLLTQTGKTFNRTIHGQLNLAAASPHATLVESSGTRSISVYDYFQKDIVEKNCGTLLQESHQRGYSSATVSVADDGCFVLFKMTYHPEWQVFVDGEKRELVMLSPAFMGVAVDHGQHDIVFSYQVAYYRILLFVLSIFSLLVAAFWRNDIS